MSKGISPPDDGYMIRCPRLGHQISFSYCRKERGSLPCFKVLDCWHGHFDVVEYLREELSEEQWEEAFRRSSKSKTQSLVELIEEAKRRKEEGL